MAKNGRGDTKQRECFAFLRKHFTGGTTFTRAELAANTSWTDRTLKTYLNKQFKGIIIEENGSMRVSDAFQKIFTWKAFQRHVSQKKDIANRYSAFCHSNVVIFEFLMPLANEIILREALDTLFYREAVERRLARMEVSEIEGKFPLRNGETHEKRIERILDFTSDKFGGYSISHVDGRFRATDLMSRDDANDLQSRGERYLVDETTAIVRFIFPCGKATKFNNLLQYEIDDRAMDKRIDREADQIRWLFFRLFVAVVIEIVNGEDEIWLIESGMNSRLHIWRG